jgi:hypothetical protein
LLLLLIRRQARRTLLAPLPPAWRTSIPHTTRTHSPTPTLLHSPPARFIRSEADDAADSWEVRLAKKYYRWASRLLLPLAGSPLGQGHCLPIHALALLPGVP